MNPPLNNSAFGDDFSERLPTSAIYTERSGRFRETPTEYLQVLLSL
jgi:hypothetical protein